MQFRPAVIVNVITQNINKSGVHVTIIHLVINMAFTKTNDGIPDTVTGPSGQHTCPTILCIHNMVYSLCGNMFRLPGSVARYKHKHEWVSTCLGSNG